MSNKDKVSTETGWSDVTPRSVSMVTADASVTESFRHPPTPSPLPRSGLAHSDVMGRDVVNVSVYPQ